MWEGNTLKIYVLIILTFNGLKAYESYIASGYQGCYRVTEAGFEDYERFYSYKNTGKICKRTCISNNFRYAGTGGIKRNYCTCFSNLSNYEYVDSDECDSVCPGSSDEICGGQRKMSVYDTWLCATIPCKNNGSCRDMSSNTYKCTCRPGWTGTNCTEPVTELTARQTQQTHTWKTRLLTRQSEKTPTTTATVIMSQASTVTTSKQTQLLTTEQKKSSYAAVYISVPVVILILDIVTVSVLLILRCRHQRVSSRRRDQKNTPHSTKFRKDSTQIRTTSEMENHVYTGHVNPHETSPYSNVYLNVTQDQFSEIQPNTINPEETNIENNEYDTIDFVPNESQKGINDYSYLKSQSSEFTDTTYSHVTEKHCENIHNGPEIYAYDHAFTGQMRSQDIVSELNCTCNKLHKLKSKSFNTQNVQVSLRDDSVYDHAVAGGYDPRIQQDNESSHLH